jgi:hypothetical protein
MTPGGNDIAGDAGALAEADAAGAALGGVSSVCSVMPGAVGEMLPPAGPAAEPVATTAITAA